MTPKLDIREVRRSDKEEVLQMTSEIWDGRDYIPEYFDRWVEDGGFICGTVDGDIIALAKHTWHSDDVLWLEGLRIHPDHQEEGYGRAMIQGQLEFIDDLDYSVVRFLTASGKTPVKKVVHDLGFKVKERYDYLRLDEEDLEKIEFSETTRIERVDQEKREKEVIDFVLSSQEFEEYEGFYLEHWTAYPMNETLIKDRIKKGNCYSVKDERTGEIDALIFLETQKFYDSLSAAFACGSREELKTLLDFGARYCIDRRLDRFRLKTGSENVVKAARKAGFDYSEHHSCTIVYEYEKR